VGGTGVARRLEGYTAPSAEAKSLDMAAEVKRLERELAEVRLTRDF